MTTLLTIIHILACITLILIVLLQAGKGANMGAAFGGSSQTVFGSSGAGTFLGKMTAAVAIIFMLTSITLTYTASRKTSGLMDGAAAPATRQELPAAQKPAPLPVSPSASPAASPVNVPPASPPAK
ncbi:MAG TPA: preprotein translocase subunit SecG [Smithellaceae bacterium]|nr:preprotein translocase subunit SecG [Smithellaceae bacterium]HRS83831.1 preprotein translocase subunit SecG [Smithellaceae bacterium]HRV44393.1 preprotein translocase subunit SecG [Smithellaceae bacterium]